MCNGLALVATCLAMDLVGTPVGAANISRHLTVSGRVNLGSFYTPAKYVALVGEWLVGHGVDESWSIADLSCGYGAFFELGEIAELAKCRYVGNDIDATAVRTAQTLFTNVQWLVSNALADVSRERFGIDANGKLVVVGNPPYNDVTSQSHQTVKTNSIPMDPDLKTRDLGMSSLLAYDKLQADLVAVLHPLSYLIKKTNFQATERFFRNYALVEHVVFSSNEFAGTSKSSSFPVIVALYKRAPGCGLTYEDVWNTWFETVEGERFSLSGFDYVTDHVKKYPSSRRYEPEILFYTMRDMNALRRSQTFIESRIANAVDVDPQKLAYYCYIDCFKRYADIPYYLGNFNVPYVESTFGTVADDVIALSKREHPSILGEPSRVRPDAEARVRRYISQALKGRKR